MCYYFICVWKFDKYGSWFVNWVEFMCRLFLLYVEKNLFKFILWVCSVYVYNEIYRGKWVDYDYNIKVLYVDLLFMKSYLNFNYVDE